ncbi:VpsF family polysaccharide biosynthesis protein [Vibrio sp. MA40-2]|uniref:VpsF family polysaccharide biosynthesis protein n=1 Tax=Vibrio sp. MA40-2 TaxID=3391828 RepID=UPI0039A5AC65
MLSEYDEDLPRLAFIFFAASVISLITLSSDVLMLFNYPFGDSYASFIYKLHPQFYFIFLCFTMVFVKQGLPGIKNILLVKTIFWWLVICILCFLYVTIILKQPMTIIITTWLCPMLMLAIYFHCSMSQKKFLHKVCIYIITINGVISIYEYVFSHHIIPKNYFSVLEGELLDISEWDFSRSVALYGHPLTATMIAALTVIGLTARSRVIALTKLEKICLVTSWASLPAFGGRTAIAVTIVLVGCMGVSSLTKTLKQGISHRNIIFFLVSLFSMPLIILFAYNLGLFDNLLARINDDNGSAETRLVALQILFDTPISSVLFGDYDKELFERQVFFGTTYGVEVFWIAIILSWGCITSVPLFALLLYLSKLLIKYIGNYIIWVCVAFALILSSGVGLSVKTLLLSQFLMVTLFVVSGAINIHDDSYD